MFRIEPRGERVNVFRMDDGKVNAIGPAFLEAFPKAWADATRDGRAIVLAGNAKAFCAGLDLKSLPGLARADLVAFARGFMLAFADVAAYDRPVVAAVDGPALAGGAVLALCSDFRLVGPRARLGLTEVPVGVPFPSPVAELGAARLPPPEHAPALLRGVVREGEQAVRTGWAHALHGSDSLEAEAISLAEELAASSPVAFAAAKRPLNVRLAESMARFARDEADAWVDVLGNPETMAGIVRGFARMTRK